METIGENLALALKGAGVARDGLSSRIEQYLRLVGLEEYINQFPLYLSGGQRQCVGLARALAIESDVVLMDEPFASVDELTARQLRETTRQLCEQLHRTVLFVTHNLAEAAYMSDFVVTLTRRPARLAELCHQPAPDAAPLGTRDLWLCHPIGNQSDFDGGGKLMKTSAALAFAALLFLAVSGSPAWRGNPCKR